MDSLPQEIIDEIIDNLPYSSLIHSSLVAKRWQKRSQLSLFREIRFIGESRVRKWYTDPACNDPDGISSYVRSVKFFTIAKWSDSTLFNNTVENFSSLDRLWICNVEITDEMVERIPSGKFGERVTALDLFSPRCSISTVTTVILSLPNLRHLCIGDYGTMPRELPSAYPATPRRKPFDSLKLVFGNLGAATEAFAKLEFTSRNLCLNVKFSSTWRLLMLSSEILGELTLTDTNVMDNQVFAPVGQRTFPALTSLRLTSYLGGPSRHLMSILHHISSIPVLASITIASELILPVRLVSSTAWDGMDKWLARIAKSITVGGYLLLTLSAWLPAETERFLPEFRKAGGKVEVVGSGVLPP